MAEVGKRARHLGPDFHLVSISVDPERDTPARLAEYGARYGANPIAWSFLTGPEQAIQATVVDGFKVGAGKERSPGATADGGPGFWEIFHGENLVLVDRQLPHPRLLPGDGRGPRQADGRRRPRRERRLTRRVAPVSTSAMSKILRVGLPLAIVAWRDAACQKTVGARARPGSPRRAGGPRRGQRQGRDRQRPDGNGTIAGTVKLTGTPPEMAMTKRQADPFCAKTPMKEEEVVVGPGGGLKNVVVRVTKGVSGHYEPPAAAATVDQSACMYRPRVQGIVLGQPVQIKNSDQTLHNIHGYKGASTLFNKAEIPGQPRDGPAVQRRRPDREAEVRRAPVDDRVRAGVQPSVLRGHGRRRKLQDHGPAARQLHGRGLARTLRRKNCGDHRRRRQARRSCVRIRSEMTR